MPSTGLDHFRENPSGWLSAEQTAASANGSVSVVDGDDSAFHDALVRKRTLELVVERDAKAALAAKGWFPPQVRTLADLDTLPDPVPLIDGILDRGTVGMLSGFTQTGKSFLALDWAMDVGTGRTWMGHAATKGRVLYVAAEDGAGLKHRTRAWRDDHGVDDVRGITFVTEAVNVSVPAQMDWLTDLVAATDAVLVVIDTYAKCSVGTEENSSTDTGRIVEQLYRVRNAADTTVLLVHHTGYDTSRARGSSALLSDIDYGWNLESADPHVLTTLTAKKRKDAQVPDAMALRLEQVKLGTGGTSCVLRGAVDAHQEQNAMIRQLSGQGLSQRAIGRQVGVDHATVGRRLKEPGF